MALTFQCHPPTKTSWNKKPCTVPPWHTNKSTLAKPHHTPPIFPPSSQGALAGAALPLPLAPGIPTKSSCLYVFLGKLLMAWANNPNKHFFSKISPWYFYLNQQCNNPNLKHLNKKMSKMSAWMSSFLFGWVRDDEIHGIQKIHQTRDVSTGSTTGNWDSLTTSWWFQPSWKILVNMGIFPK